MNLYNLKKIKLARKLIEDGKKYHYVKNGKKRIYSTVVKTSELTHKGQKILDIGGSDRKNYSFKEYTLSLCDVEYNYITRGNLDIRIGKLPYDNDSFDLVGCHEAIEHFWLMHDGGMLNWDGILNFWKEAYRVLKPNGTFYVSTRNRVCPLALLKVLTNDFIQVSFPTVSRKGHVNELCAKDLRSIADATKLFTANTIFSTSSLPRYRQAQVNQKTPRLQNFLGREILQEELYDTLHFISKKYRHQINKK